MPLTRREEYEGHLAALKQERATWESPWTEIANNLRPYSDPLGAKHRRKRNDGERLGKDIIDLYPLDALRIAVSGMMSGITSTVRAWHQYTVTGDPDLSEYKPVKLYLEQRQKIVSMYLRQSNWYNMLANSFHPDLLSFGTAVAIEDEDPNRAFNFTPVPIGEYYLGTNHDREVDVYYGVHCWSVWQIVSKFGLENVSQMVKDCWNKASYATNFIVCRRIAANTEFVEGKRGLKGKKYLSCWWEESNPNKEQFLQEAGYNEFPVLVGRWSVENNDTYGRGSPGWISVGACKALQHRARQGAKLTDKSADPPMNAIGNVSNWSLVPGAVNEIAAGGEMDFRPAMQVNPSSMNEVRLDRDEIRDQISSAFYVRLFQAMADDDRKQRPTATEVEAIRQENMLMFGPLLQSMDENPLRPAIERSDAILERFGLLPPPPPELKGRSLDVRFISIAHQAQKAAGLGALQTVVSSIAGLAQIDQNVLHKLDTDAVVDALIDMTGVTAKIIRSKQEIEAIRAKAAQQAEAQQQVEMAARGSEAIRNVGQTDPQNMQQVMRQMGPAVAAAAGGLAPVR